MSDVEARFLDLVAVGEAGECWPFTGSKRKTGHGQFRYEGRLRSAAALALIFAGKPQPFGAHALHSCDNPPCCNPSHLRWGTNLENVKDMVDRGRSWAMIGECNPASRLTPESVAAIYKAGAEADHTRAEIARKYGVGEATIRDIWVGNSWNAVTGLPNKRRRVRRIDSLNKA